MDNILCDLPGVCCYLDDVLISTPSQKEHLKRLETVFQLLTNASLRLKKKKCSFLASEVSYLWHRFDQTGLHPLNENVCAISDAPRLTCLVKLHSYLGLLNYYAKFLPKISTVLAPLNKLQRKCVVYHWGQDQEKTFQCSKELLQSSQVLVHFDPDKDIILAWDASPYGIGCVRSHKMPDGQEHPVAFASRPLTDTETRCAQLDKEGLSIVYRVKAFSPISSQRS